MTFNEYLELLRRAQVNPPRDISAYFFQLKNDKRRYRFCLAMMEHYRTLWWRGQRESESSLNILDSRALRLRYGHLTLLERKRLGAIKWFTSTTCRDLAAAEQMYCRWAQTYAASVDVEGLL